MKAINVHVGETYEVRVSGNLARVRIVSTHPSGGWNGVNEATGREIRLRSARRLRCNLTLRDHARAYHAAKAAATVEPALYDRSVNASDFDGTEFAIPKPTDGSPGPRAVSDLFKL